MVIAPRTDVFKPFIPRSVRGGVYAQRSVCRTSEEQRIGSDNLCFGHSVQISLKYDVDIFLCVPFNDVVNCRDNKASVTYQ